MREFSNCLPDSGKLATNEGRNSFSLNPSNQKLKELHLHEEVDPNSRIKFYIQSKNPSELNGEPAEVVLLLSLGPIKIKARRLFFKIMNIPKRSLEKSGYRPFDYAFANIVLDRKGLEDLIDILSESHDFILAQGGL